MDLHKFALALLSGKLVSQSMLQTLKKALSRHGCWIEAGPQGFFANLAFAQK
jgi:hypothetical protein